MAETVKKSRIVSEAEENLEESLLEEFNLRLKKCMSRDDLQTGGEDDPDTTDTTHVYENIEIIKANGAAPISVHHRNGNLSQEFLEAERLHCDTLGATPNGHQAEEDFENLGIETRSLEKRESTKTDFNLNQSPDEKARPDQPSLNLPMTCLIDASESLEENPDAKSVKDRMFLSTDDASCLLFTQTVTSPMLTPSEENIDFLKGFRRESSQYTLSDNTNSSNSPKSEPKGECNESNMETVVDSPLVTDAPKEEVIYENTEFLNERLEAKENVESLVNESVDRNVDEPLSENVVENFEKPQDDIEAAVDVKEQTLKFIVNETYFIDKTLEIENQEVVANEEVPQRDFCDLEGVNQEVLDSEIVTNQEVVTDLDQKTTPTGQNLIHGDLTTPTVQNLIHGDLTTPTGQNLIHGDLTTPKGQNLIQGDLNTPTGQNLIHGDFIQQTEETRVSEEMSDFHIESVKVLKSHFMKSESTELLKSPRLETSDELDELKSLNIMKQISRFENSTNKTEEITNVCSNVSVSTITESRFVETTTESHGSGDINLKKKKTKKSKNQHEKENISVNETNTNEEESFYNVSVKNLCRSFGDLTKIEGEQLRNWKNNERSRTRSMTDVRTLEIGKKIENVFAGVSVKALKSSFSKFDALQKKNVLNAKPDQENVNGGDGMNCKKCGRAVFQMEKIIAERCIYHRNCFRCVECSKQLLVDNFESHEGTLYCKPHFRALFVPKPVEDDTPSKPRKHEVIIRENQPAELPPGVVRASDKPDLGLEELHSLNVKERFQVFENAKQTGESQLEKNTVKMERSPSILSKLARFQAKGMNVGVTDDALNGVPVEVSSSEEEEVEEELDVEDADLVRAKRVQKEKPFHFSQMNDVKNKWERVNQQDERDERREERKQEIQNIRSRLFMGKQGKMKEAYQQAITESHSAANMKKEVPVDVIDARSIKDRFEKGEVVNNELRHKETEDMSVFESGISKKSRSIFQELDSSGGAPPKISPSSPPKLGNSVRSAREAYLAKQASEDTVRSTDQPDEITIRTADIQDRFKFFETYKEPQQKRREFRMTPPREGQIKSATPEREVYVDPDVVRSEDYIEDSVVAKATHTTTKMLSKFRQMEENLQKGHEPQGPKPLKRFTPPREPLRRESSSEEESGSEESEEEVDNPRMPERDLLEAQKAARAKQLRAKFERWEESEVEVRRDSQVNIVEESGGDDQSQVETARSLRAKFESLRENTNGPRQSGRVKVNRFVDVANLAATCDSCRRRVYPLELITVHGHVFHKSCFRCKECNAVLRMDSYSYNQGLLYCTTHFKRLFITKGNYDTAFGLEQHKEKWNMTTVA